MPRGRATASSSLQAEKRTRDAYAGDAYVATRGDGTKERRLGTKGLTARNAELRAEGERIAADNAAKRAEGERIDKANAGRSAALDERAAKLAQDEAQLAKDREALDADRAEVSRLLDGYERPATEADFMPPLPPDADAGTRVYAEFQAGKAFGAACRENGHKPPTVHEPGLRETVKAAAEARASYEAAAEEARRERDALRDYRGGMVELLEGLCRSVKMTQMEFKRSGHPAAAKLFQMAHGVFAKALVALDNAAVPEAPTLDRDAWDAAIESAKAEEARADERAHAAAYGTVREVLDAARRSRPGSYDGPSL